MAEPVIDVLLFSRAGFCSSKHLQARLGYVSAHQHSWIVAGHADVVSHLRGSPEAVGLGAVQAIALPVEAQPNKPDAARSWPHSVQVFRMENTRISHENTNVHDVPAEAIVTMPLQRSADRVEAIQKIVDMIQSHASVPFIGSIAGRHIVIARVVAGDRPTLNRAIFRLQEAKGTVVHSTFSHLVMTPDSTETADAPDPWITAKTKLRIGLFVRYQGRVETKRELILAEHFRGHGCEAEFVRMITSRRDAFLRVSGPSARLGARLVTLHGMELPTAAEPQVDTKGSKEADKKAREYVQSIDHYVLHIDGDAECRPTNEVQGLVRAAPIQTLVELDVPAEKNRVHALNRIAKAHEGVLMWGMAIQNRPRLLLHYGMTRNDEIQLVVNDLLDLFARSSASTYLTFRSRDETLYLDPGERQKHHARRDLLIACAAYGEPIPYPFQGRGPVKGIPRYFCPKKWPRNSGPLYDLVYSLFRQDEPDEWFELLGSSSDYKNARLQLSAAGKVERDNWCHT